MAYATADQYRAKYSADMADSALSEWLADASGVIDDELAKAGKTAEGIDGQRLMRICRDMVHRAIGDGSAASFAIPSGATQASMSAGGYSESFTMGNPYGDLYMRASELSALGIGRGRFAVAAPSFGNAEVGA